MPKHLISVALGLLSLLTAAIRVDAHAFLVRAEPRVGSKIKKAPIEVRLWFSEPIQPRVSSVTVSDGNGKPVDRHDSHLDQHDGKLLEVSLRPGLAPGTYRVLWRVTSVDTHATTGDFRFQIAP